MATEGTFWAIRQKSTGLFLGFPEGKFRRGFTHVQPTMEGPPRLFAHKWAAKSSLTWWLKGAIKAVEYQDFEGNWDYHLDILKDSKQHRDKDDFHVVEMEIICYETILDNAPTLLDLLKECYKSLRTGKPNAV